MCVQSYSHLKSRYPSGGFPARRVVCYVCYDTEMRNSE